MSMTWFHTSKERFFTAVGYDVSARLFVCFIALALLLERYDDMWVFIEQGSYGYLLFEFAAIAALFRAFLKGIDRWFAIFVFYMIYMSFFQFRSSANHSFFAIWLLAPLGLFPKGWNTEDYSNYVRRSVGLVMMAAATQKLISGNFLNGHFLQYLASGSAPMQEMFLFSACMGTPAYECDMLVFLSILSVVWQYAIGILLLINCRHILAFLTEVVFVLSVGFVTDEMNFQTINVAALLIAFRVSALPIVFVCLMSLLIIDEFLIATILRTLLAW